MLEQSIRFRARFLTAFAVLSALLFFGLTPANAADLNNATISGTVTVPAGVERSNLSISAQSAEGHHRWGQFNDDGTFVVTDLPAGSYKLQVGGYATGALEQWYGGTSLETATEVIVTAGQSVTGINIALVKGASIAGKISFPPGVDITYLNVYAQEYEHSNYRYGQINPDGTYKIVGLPAGTFKLHFSGSNSGAMDVWYGNAGSFQTATPVTLTAGQDLPGIDATLVKGASVSGRVTAPAGVDLSNINVSIRGAESMSFTGYGYANETGDYSIKGLPAGSYKVQFSSFDSGLLDTWYENAESFESATVLTVSAGQDLAAINGGLVNGASISGKLTAPAGVDLTSVYVSAYSANRASSRSGQVDADGNYTVQGLPAGTYKIEFRSDTSGALTQWYTNGTSFETATAVQVSAGQALGGINATLVKSASISGVVTAPAGVDKSRVSVLVSPVNNSSLTVHSAGIAPDGTYKVSGFPAGSYTVMFSAFGSGALNQWYPMSQAGPAAVSFSTGQDLTGADVTLVKGSSVGGKITAPAGTDMAALTVLLRRTDDPRAYGMSTSVNVDGTYRFLGLAAGTYSVEFFGNGTGLLSQQGTDGKAIVLAAGQDVNDVNTTMATGAAIRGKLTVSTGVDVTSLRVNAYLEDGTTYASQGSVAPDGTYKVSGLPAGKYKVQFAGSGSGALDEWFDNAADAAAATTIVLTTAQQRTGVDATLAEGGTISGKVVAGAGVNLSTGWTYATIFGAETGNSAVSTPSIAPDGSFSLRGLTAGNYKILFSSYNTGAVNRWFGGSDTFTAAATIAVGAGQKVTIADTTLVKGATITGKITGPAGTDFSSARVFAHLSGSEPNGQFNSPVNSNGEYSITGLPAGAFKVKFDGGVSGAAQTWYGGSSESSATSLTLATSQTRSAVDITAVVGATLTGKVSGGSSNHSYPVDILDSAGNTIMNRYTSSDGTYSVRGLAAGSYKVAFNRSSGYTTTEEAQFYNNKPESAGVAQAQSIVVGSGQSVPNINATLVQGGSITGTATDLAGKPVAGTGVLAYTSNGSLIARTGVTDAAGKYSIQGLSTGLYLLKLRGSTPLLADLYSGNTTSEAAATPVAVTAGQPTALDLEYATAQVTTTVPTITGTPKVGSVLTAVPGAWGPSPVTLAYQWKVNGTPVTGATAGTYKPVAADAGKTVTVSVTGTKTGYANAVSTSVPSGTVMALNPVLTAPAPTIIGTAKVGSLLTAVPGTWGPSPVTVAYQWKASGIAITGATTATYKPVAADVGKTLTVTATGTKAGYTTAAKTSVATAAVARGTLTAPVPTITGTAKVGSLLTAVPGTWGPAPVALAYQWKASGIAITGATTATYRPVAATLGKTLTVTVTGSKTGYTTAAKTSVATAAVTRGTLTAPVPTITGTAKVGSLLTAVPGTWGPAPVALAYQWKASGIAITGATTATYRPVAATLGKTLTVTVTGSKTGYNTAAKTSVATAAVTRGTLTAPVPTITGTAKVGSLLTAVPGIWGPAPVTLAYQWKANGIAITGATARTYTLAAATTGKTITVTVTGTKAGYTTAAKTSVATRTVMALNPALVSPAPKITGTAAVGSVLTAVPGTWGPAPVTLTYQWKANGVSISGATAVIYTPVAGNLGKTLTVTVTGTKPGYTTTAKTSLATTAVK
ncbi:SdrD B-like domain-containing protein [Arthrobacter sp. Z4-13]